MTTDDLKNAVKNLNVYLEECVDDDATVVFTRRVIKSIKENYEELIRLRENAESLQNRYDLAVAEREANMKAYLEQAKELAAARATIKELEAECERQYEQAEADIRGNMADGGTSCHWCIDGHKAEARKEFAESLHKAIDGFREKREMPMLPYTAAALEFVDRKIDELVKAGEQE